MSHNLATPQTDGYIQKNYDRNGNESGVLYESGRADFIIEKTGKQPFIFQTYKPK